jgi:hypothetical protein
MRNLGTDWERRERMENNQPTIEQLLKNMEKISGGDPRPMRVLAQINPAFVFEQARSRKMVMDLPFRWMDLRNY